VVLAAANHHDHGDAARPSGASVSASGRDWPEPVATATLSSTAAASRYVVSPEDGMAGSERSDVDRGRGTSLDDLVARIAADPRRRIPVPGTLNLRDVGGYPVSGGGSIAWRMLLRSDAPLELDDAGLATLAGLNLRSVLDLRTSAEIQLVPSPLDELADRGTLTTYLSLVGEDFSGLPTDLGEIYPFMIDYRGTQIGAAVRSLARPGGLPGLVHCAAGKDRTGVVVALVLATIGVPDEFIAADYALSGRYLAPVQLSVTGRAGVPQDDQAGLMISPPWLILAALDHARKAGSIEAYLSGHGVTEADLATLRAALVTDALPAAGAGDRGGS
jgi:protein-tyrosine phosphatase